MPGVLSVPSASCMWVLEAVNRPLETRLGGRNPSPCWFLLKASAPSQTLTPGVSESEGPENGSWTGFSTRTLGFLGGRRSEEES